VDTADHQAEILDQFTKQAEPFLARHNNPNDGVLSLMVDCADPRPEDSLLDVACGPGIVSCFFAARVGHVTGLDMVPAMLAQAQRLQAQRGLKNIAWCLGDSTTLPFADAAFDKVVTRFSFHHFLDPLGALREMQRVCKTGGTIVVADVTPAQRAQERFNQWEILRDPSHTRALTLQELRSLGSQLELKVCRCETFQLEMDLEDLLRGSFPRAGDADRIRALFNEEIESGSDELGVAARRSDTGVAITYPVSVIAWTR
jgi:SAM-dependent methyltransferase